MSVFPSSISYIGMYLGGSCVDFKSFESWNALFLFFSNMNVSFLHIEFSALNKFQNFESTISLSFNGCY